MSSEDEDLRALVVALELDALEGPERERAEAAVARDPELVALRDRAREALGDPEPGPLCAPPAAWDGIAARIAEVRASELVRAVPPVSLRCTYCHDGLERPRASYCASCLAPHHADCFATHGVCAAPGCGETQVVQPAAPSATPAPRRGRGWVVLAAGAALAVGAAAFASWSGERSGPAGAGTQPAAPSEAAELLRSASDHLALYAQGQSLDALDQARRDVEQARRLDPGSARAALLEGLLLLATPSPDMLRVNAAFARAVECDPDDPLLREALAWSCLDLGLYERAYEHYLAAQARSAAPRVEADLGAFYALCCLGRQAQAEAAVVAACERHPASPRVWAARGGWEARVWSVQRALVSYERALALDPLDPELLVERARCLGALHRDDEALRDLQRAVELAPRFVGAWVELSRLLLRGAQDVAGALAAAERAYELEASPSSAQALVGALRALSREPDPELTRLANSPAPPTPPWPKGWGALLERARAR